MQVFESWVPSIERLHGLTMRMQVSGGRVGGLFFSRMVVMGWPILLTFIIVIIGVGDRESRCDARPCIPGRLLGHLQQ